MFMDTHNESVFRLTGFTDKKIVLTFPCNFAKMDPVTKQIDIFDCLSNIHVVDSAGMMYIFNLEENLIEPISKVKVLVGEDYSVVNCFYNFQTSIIHMIFKRNTELFFMKYE
jgi:hypothetical protein